MTFEPRALAKTIGDWSAPLASARAPLRASKAGHYTAASLAASARDIGPGGDTIIRGGSCPPESSAGGSSERGTA